MGGSTAWVAINAAYMPTVSGSGENGAQMMIGMGSYALTTPFRPVRRSHTASDSSTLSAHVLQATYTVNNLIQGALKRINSLLTGPERLNGVDVADVLETLNDMLDSWSLDKLMVFSSNENILSW